MIQVAIVGLGNIGNNHARCYTNNPDTKLVAVCDINKERADKAAAAYDAKAFYSIKEMLASGMKINAVSVCTAGTENGGDHYTPTMELLKAGLPVLGEKPISNDLDKAKKMVALGKKKKLAYGINLNHRFTPAALRAKEWVEAGRIGQMNMINMLMWINNPNETSPHFHMRALHPHSFDVMRYFAGDVKKVHAFFRKGDGRKCWSNVQVNLQFKSGVIGHLTGSYDGGGPGHHWGLETCEIIGQDARIVIEDACEKLTIQPRKTLESESYTYLGNMKSFGETFQSRINAWVEDLKAKKAWDKIQAPASDALKSQAIIEACIESWDNNSVVSL